MSKLQIYFSDIFRIGEDALREFGTVNISLVSDLPLFIDPFLLFNSSNPAYQDLHSEIIHYLSFLREKSEAGTIRLGLLDDWFSFPEVHQLWMGYSASGNKGTGLGPDFARKLHRNLHEIFTDFGEEEVTHGSHLEKLCLIEPGVGRDHIADFTANLIKSYLASYTEIFAKSHLDPELVETRILSRAAFNYDTESWGAEAYVLPIYRGEAVLLAPRDILTKDETWINRSDLLVELPDVIASVENHVQRARMNNYFLNRLPLEKEASKQEMRAAAEATIQEFPSLIEYFIREKEESGAEAVWVSDRRVRLAEKRFITNVGALAEKLAEGSAFYELGGGSLDEAMLRLEYLREVIENKGGWRLFYVDGEPFRREHDLQIAFRFVWFGTTADVSREVDDGRGPADYKVSRGLDKTIVEFKLATNRKLRQNLQHQTEAYQSASDAPHGIKAIMYFTDPELHRVQAILEELGLAGNPRIFLIDCRPKASASAVA